jgi:hypothetical protein
VSKDYEQAIRRLKKEGLIVGEVPSRAGGHRKLTLVDGSTYTAACSPNDPRAFKNLERGIRRTVKNSLHKV